MKFLLIGHYVDPYTWELVKLNKTVNIGSKEAAVTWAKQTFHRCTINKVIKINSK